MDKVIISNHKKNTKDISVTEGLLSIRPHVLAKGGDRHAGNIPTPDVAVCDAIGCMIVNDVGFGGKVQSSSELVKQAQKNKQKKIKCYRIKKSLLSMLTVLSP